MPAIQTPLAVFLQSNDGMITVSDWVQQRAGSHCRVLSGGPQDSCVFIKQVPESKGAALPRDVWSLCALYRSGRDIVPEPLAWHDSPPYMAYRWVPGQLLSDELRDRSADGREVASLIAACADALAWVHEVECSSLHPQTPVRHARAGRRGDAVPSVVDLGPWNLIVRSDGRVVFIDVQLRTARREFDVGRLIVGLAMASTRHPQRLPAAVLVSQRTCRLFLDAYESRVGAGVRVSVWRIWLASLQRVAGSAVRGAPTTAQYWRRLAGLVATEVGVSAGLLPGRRRSERIAVERPNHPVRSGGPDPSTGSVRITDARRPHSAPSSSSD